MIEMFGREITLEQLRGFVKGHEKDGEIRMPSEWVLEILDKAQEYEKRNKLDEDSRLSEMDSLLEPLKVESALSSEVLKLNYRQEHKPESINILDYTIIKALAKQIPRKRNFDNVDTYLCPDCDEEVEDSEYCPHCGQRMIME